MSGIDRLLLLKASDPISPPNTPSPACFFHSLRVFRLVNLPSPPTSFRSVLTHAVQTNHPLTTTAAPSSCRSELICRPSAPTPRRVIHRCILILALTLQVQQIANGMCVRPSPSFPNANATASLCWCLHLGGKGRQEGISLPPPL